MAVQNVLEPAVTRAVRDYREEVGHDRTTCWCPLCEKDVTALSLTNLPPLYCGAPKRAGKKVLVEGQRIANAIASASKRVCRCPRHPYLHPERFEDAAVLKNFVLEEVADLVTSGGREEEECDCDCCTTDRMAYALNRFPPRYGVVWRGSCSFPDYQRELMRHELGMVLVWASAVVSRNPRHRHPQSDTTHERRTS